MTKGKGKQRTGRMDGRMTIMKEEGTQGRDRGTVKEGAEGRGRRKGFVG